MCKFKSKVTLSYAVNFAHQSVYVINYHRKNRILATLKGNVTQPRHVTQIKDTLHISCSIASSVTQQ